MGKIFKGGNINEKDCVDDFIVGFDYGVGRVPLVASWRRPRWWPWWRPLRKGKMRQLLSKGDNKIRKLSWVRIASISWVPYAYGVSGDTQFPTRILEMTLEKDGWRVDLSHPYGIEVRR